MHFREGALCCNEASALSFSLHCPVADLDDIQEQELRGPCLLLKVYCSRVSSM